MKKYSFTMICLLIIQLLACSPNAGLAQAEDENELHQYLGIPFDSATSDDVSQILLEKAGITLSESNRTGIQYYTDGVSYLGFENSLLVEFNKNHIGINRIHLSKSGRSVWSSDADEFKGMVREDILAYIDMESKLIKQYGEPNWRFFTTNGERYSVSGTARFMFPSDQWDAEQMMDVCQNDKSLHAHTAWGNVVLDLWVIWHDEDSKKSKSSLSLYFYNKLAEIDTDSIIMLPARDS